MCTAFSVCFALSLLTRLQFKVNSNLLLEIFFYNPSSKNNIYAMYITELRNGSQYIYKLIFNGGKTGLQIRKETIKKM
jgi:hypothetical protein